MKAPERPAWWRWPILVLLVLFWRRQRDEFYPEGRPPSLVRVDRRANILRALAAQDWLLLLYLVTLGGEILAGHGPKRSLAFSLVAADLLIFVAVLFHVRRSSSQPTAPRAFLYRIGILVALLGSFFELQWILPAASGSNVDASLYALDLRVFGVEPAVTWDRFVRPATTEWFAFFYYGYFIIVALHVLPAMFFGRDQRFLVTLGFGFLWLYCVGHVVYTLVPAYGPYAHLTFAHRLEGAVWWPLVKRTVASVDGSARTDVFPSLHTAGPTFLALFSFSSRKRVPFKYTWIPLGFVATQIVIATMFLRWHYLIDICAGILLAVSGMIMGRVALRWDDARVAAGGPPAWPPLAVSGSILARPAGRASRRAQDAPSA